MGKKMALKETDGKKGGQQHRNLGDADWDEDGVCMVGRWAQAMEDFEQVTKSGNITTLNKSW